MSIVVIGTAFVDIKGFPEDNYIPNGRNVGRVEYVHGGVARNVVEDIANLELRPTYLGIVDDTPMGTDVLEKLRRHKVNVDHVLTIPDGMGTWLAVFDSNGDVAGSISKRPNAYPLLGLLEEKGDAVFAEADSVVLQLDMHKDVVKKVLSLSKKYGKKLFALVSNMSIASQRRDFLQQFHCFICNQQEAGILFVDDYSQTAPEDLALILKEKVAQAGIPAMVVTMGEQGAVYSDGKDQTGICPAKKVEVRDTTGAGDAFCAGVVCGLTYGKELAKAVQIGTTLAASVIISQENVCPRFRPEEFGLQTR